jgi:hypothetical protein
MSLMALRIISLPRGSCVAFGLRRGDIMIVGEGPVEVPVRGLCRSMMACTKRKCSNLLLVDDAGQIETALREGRPLLDAAPLGTVGPTISTLPPLSRVLKFAEHRRRGFGNALRGMP